MKKFILSTMLFTLPILVNAQNTFPTNGSVGIGTSTPASEAILDMSSTTQGVYFPRMTQAQRNAIVNPQLGLIIFQTNGARGLYFYNGSTWAQVTKNAWQLVGNSGLNMTDHFIGTKDNMGVAFRTNNIERMRIQDDGKVGIGTTAPETNLHVQGNARFDLPLNSDYVTINNYGGGLKVNNPYTNTESAILKATSGGPFYQAQLELSNLVGYTHLQSPQANGGDTSMLTTSGDMWFRNGTGTVNMAIKKTGNVGIGTTSPAAKLDVQGNVKIADGTEGAGKVLTSDANGLATWQTPTGGGWGLTGNAGTTASNFIGTSDNNNLRFRTNNSERLTILNNGSVGVNTQNPSEVLEVNKNIAARSSQGTNGTWGSFRMGTNNATYNDKWAGMASINTGGDDQADLRFYTTYGNRDERMRISQNGHVSIGTSNPAWGYLLTVNGKIICTELKVQLQPFPDYVFAKDYRLKSIEEVEQHIKDFQRLPNMPSACEVEEGGLSVGEMTGKLVEKVEELTLYIIQQQKEIDALKAELNASKK